MKSKNAPRIDPVAFRRQVAKMRAIEGYISRGEEIPAELSKNFVSFPLTDDPYIDIE